MKHNRIIVVIDRPLEEVFGFTTTPANTSKWIPSITEEISDRFPPQMHTIYKNHGATDAWTFYKVIDFEPNRRFTLSDLDANYHVRYSYKALDERTTELEYYEWNERGELSDPFTKDILRNLKLVMEK
jgi:uncharacterized protein YndB with AHSA1/START domain